MGAAKSVSSYRRLHVYTSLKLAWVLCILKISNLIPFTGCEHSDSLRGFYYSHDGYWTGEGAHKRAKSRKECAKLCKQGCVGISTSATEFGRDIETRPHCFHYSNRSDLVSTNEKNTSIKKAYIKCIGRNE